MGGLFSSETPRQPSPLRSYHEQPPPVGSTRTYTSSPQIYTESYDWTQNVNDYYRQELLLRGITRNLQSLEINASGRRCRVEEPERSRRNPQLFNMSNSFYDNTYTLIPLSQHDSEYVQITRKISNKRNFKVDSIEKIENPYLQKAYELKKIQKESQYFNVEELLLFHGTKRVYVDAICKKNFNWRLCQAHKYGRGVSFSPNSTYASVYSDRNVYQKVMIVAKVLIGRSCIGNKFMEIPPEGCDTSQKGSDRIVVVKYEDNDFCPVYKINYHVMNENVGMGRGHKKRGGKFVSNNFSFDSYFFDFDSD